MTQPAADPGRGKCGAKKHQSEGTCTRPAGWGTDHPGIGSCKLHAGSTPNHVASATEEQARRLAAKWALPVQTSAADALTAELARTNGLVLWLEQKCAELDNPVWGLESRIVRSNPGGGADRSQPQVEVVQAARLDPYVSWLQQERTHLSRLATDMSRLGLEARTVRLAESQALMMLRVMRLVVADMRPSEEQIALAAESVHRRFGQLVGQEPPGESAGAIPPPATSHDSGNGTGP